jgi:hypothetical protein
LPSLKNFTVPRAMFLLFFFSHRLRLPAVMPLRRLSLRRELQANEVPLAISGGEPRLKRLLYIASIAAGFKLSRGSGREITTDCASCGRSRVLLLRDAVSAYACRNVAAQRANDMTLYDLAGT